MSDKKKSKNKTDIQDQDQFLEDEFDETDEIDVASLLVERNDQAAEEDPVAIAPMQMEEEAKIEELDLQDLAEEDYELFQAASKEKAQKAVVNLADDVVTEDGDQHLTDIAALPEKINLEGQIEAIIFASEKSIRIQEIVEIIEDEAVTYEVVNNIVKNLIKFYNERGGGFRLENIRGGGYQFRTSPAAGNLMERMFSTRPRPISRAAQETLAIIAYRQPVTRADVEFIRGVDAGSIMKNLLERDLIKCVGRKEDAGRPMMFGTTDEFLRVYQLNSLKDLPPLDSFQPSPDTIKGASEALNTEREVDIEDFIKDVDQDKNLDDDLSEDVALALQEDEFDEEVLEDNIGPLTGEADPEVLDLETLKIPQQITQDDIPLFIEGASASHELADEDLVDLLVDEDNTNERIENGGNEITEVGFTTGDRIEKGSGEMD